LFEALEEEMFTRVRDFEKVWRSESESTLKLLRALTDASLSQAVGPEDRTLGRVAWHIVASVPEMAERTGLRIDGARMDDPVPAAAASIVAAYERVSAPLLAQVATEWTDATLEVEDEMYGEKWKRGFTLQALIAHQTHHRGQMTVLMRQAGLKVPGVYGPAREEWSAYGAPAPAV
jgi:uncharacterized damage-inducible protein DinB